MAIPVIPVLSFRPNWKDGLTESLIWLTDVMASDVGAEQRRALRIGPARQFEASFLLQGAERTFFDLFLSRAANQEMFVPFWHDIGRTTTATALGADRLDLDTRWREFTEGGYAIIQQSSALEYEIVEIISVDDTGLDLAADTTRAWPVGTKVMPVRRGRFNADDAVSYDKHTSRVAESTFRINIVEPNDWVETEADPSPVYNGYPVFTLTPDLNSTVEMQFARMLKALGNDFGKSFYADAANRAFVAQGHSWFLKGRLAQARFRDFLYRVRGRARAFWLPTFNDDLQLVSTEVGGSTTFEVNKTGFALAGGPGPGRDHVAIFLNDGSVIVRKITMLQMPSVTWREKIKLSAALGVGISPATVKRISFCDLARLDQDQIDLEHHTDSDGVTTSTAVFRTFGDTRDASGTIYYPIPLGFQSETPCGTFDEDNADPCIEQFCTPQTTFSGVLAFRGCNTGYCPTRNWYMPSFADRPPGYENIVHPPRAPGGPSGISTNTLSIVNNCAGTTSIIYESNVYNEVGGPWYHDPLAIDLQGQPLIVANSFNGDFTITVIGALATGPGQIQIQYGAFWCGDNVSELVLTRTIMAPPDCVPTPTELLRVNLVGNTPYTFTWD